MSFVEGKPCLWIILQFEHPQSAALACWAFRHPNLREALCKVRRRLYCPLHAFVSTCMCQCCIVQHMHMSNFHPPTISEISLNQCLPYLIAFTHCLSFAEWLSTFQDMDACRGPLNFLEQVCLTRCAPPLPAAWDSMSNCWLTGGTYTYTTRLLPLQITQHAALCRPHGPSQRLGGGLPPSTPTCRWRARRTGSSRRPSGSKSNSPSRLDRASGPRTPPTCRPCRRAGPVSCNGSSCGSSSSSRKGSSSKSSRKSKSSRRSKGNSRFSN